MCCSRNGQQDRLGRLLGVSGVEKGEAFVDCSVWSDSEMHFFHVTYPLRRGGQRDELGRDSGMSLYTYSSILLVT